MLIEKVSHTIERYRMIGAGNVVVGVSGGVDSVVLLDILTQLLPRNRLIIAHLDHMIRGAAARADSQFVADLGTQLGIPVVVDRVDVPRISQEQGLNLEDAGRRARDAFFTRVAAAHGADRIAIGHTRDDVVETVMFNLVRGAGPTGLGGIKPVRLPYVRPLIDTSREEIAAYARAHGLNWREDATNRDVRFTRNLIRHRVVPLLETINPQVRAAIARAAEVMRDETAALEWLLDPVWNEVHIEAATGVAIDRKRLVTLPNAVQDVIIRRAIARARGGLTAIDRSHIDAIRRICTRSRGHNRIDVPGLRIEVDRDRVQFSPAGTEVRASVAPIAVHLSVPGRTVIPPLGIAITAHRAPWTGGDYPAGETAEVVDAERVEFPLYVRTRRPGDRFQPLGMAAAKKLADVLIDAKVPFHARARLPLVCDQAGIIWVVGVRVAERVKVTERTRDVVLMQVEEIA